MDEAATKKVADLSSAKKKTLPFLNLIPEMKYEICSWLSHSEKFELLVKSTCPEKEGEYFLLRQLYSGIRTDDDIHAAVNAWCTDPEAVSYTHLRAHET